MIPTTKRCVVAAITALGLGLRLHYLQRLDVPTDEAITLWFVTTLSPAEIATTVPLVQPHYPTYYLLLKAWFVLVGESPLLARAPSVLAGTATIPLIYLIAQRLHNWQAGVLAGLMVALSPFAIAHSQLIRMYALLAFFTALSWWRLLVYLDDANRRNLALYAAATAGLVYLHYFGTIYLAMQLMYALIVLSRRETWTGWPAPAAGTLVMGPGALWIAYRLVSSPGPGVESVMGLKQPMVWDGLRFLVHFLWGKDIAWLVLNHYYVIIGPGMLAISIGIIAVVGRDWEVSDRAILCSLWLLGPMVVLYAYSQFKTPVFRPRYLVGSAYGLYVAVAVGVIGTPDRRVRIGVAVLLVVSMAGAAAVSYDTNSYGAREAFNEIESASPDRERVVVIGLFSKVWRYHVQGVDVNVVVANKTVDRTNVSPAIAGERVFVVHRQYGAWGPQSFAPEYVGLDCYQVVNESEYAEVTVYDLRQDAC